MTFVFCSYLLHSLSSQGTAVHKILCSPLHYIDFLLEQAAQPGINFPAFLASSCVHVPSSHQWNKSRNDVCHSYSCTCHNIRSKGDFSTLSSSFYQLDASDKRPQGKVKHWIRTWKIPICQESPALDCNVSKKYASVVLGHWKLGVGVFIIA